MLDGYFWVGDTGGAIVGKHVDLFVGEEARYLNFIHADYQTHFGTKTYLLPTAPKELDPKTNAGLAEILRRKKFLPETGTPSESELRGAVVAFQKTQPRINAAEYGDPDAATTLWFMIQAALELQAEDDKSSEAAKESKKKKKLLPRKIKR